jgi:hypothetical protein
MFALSDEMGAEYVLPLSSLQPVAAIVLLAPTMIAFPATVLGSDTLNVVVLPIADPFCTNAGAAAAGFGGVASTATAVKHVAISIDESSCERTRGVRAHARKCSGLRPFWKTLLTRFLSVTYR